MVARQKRRGANEGAATKGTANRVGFFNPSTGQGAIKVIKEGLVWMAEVHSESLTGVSQLFT